MSFDIPRFHPRNSLKEDSFLTKTDEYLEFQIGDSAWRYVTPYGKALAKIYGKTEKEDLPETFKRAAWFGVYHFHDDQLNKARWKGSENPAETIWTCDQCQEQMIWDWDC